MLFRERKRGEGGKKKERRKEKIKKGRIRKGP